MSPLLPRRHAGFTLVEIALVIAIIGLAAGMLLTVSTGMRDGQSSQLVRTQLDTIDTALANFVALNKRLPCPAYGNIASGVVNVGIETLSPGPPPAATPPKGTCNPATQANGVVPWVTLGLTEADITDPWLGRITYRVDPALAQGTPLTLLMDMSNCDPSSSGAVAAGNTCKTPVAPCTGNAGCTAPTNFLLNKGLDVWDGVNGNTGWASRQNNRGLSTGAAYLLVSHGATGKGAYNSSGLLQPGTGPAYGVDEGQNRNFNAVVVVSIQATTYRDAPLNDNTTGNHFDDYLSHPTIMSVLNRANLGPRAH